MSHSVDSLEFEYGVRVLLTQRGGIILCRCCGATDVVCFDEAKGH